MVVAESQAVTCYGETGRIVWRKTDDGGRRRRRVEEGGGGGGGWRGWCIKGRLSRTVKIYSHFIASAYQPD